VAITVRNVNGKPVGPTMLALYLAGAANGEQLSAVAPSGAFGCAQPGVLGNDIAVLQAGKVLLIQTMADGRYTLSLTDAAKGSFRVTVMIGEVAQLVLTTLSGFYG
jgi:hypothetical protein